MPDCNSKIDDSRMATCFCRLKATAAFYGEFKQASKQLPVGEASSETALPIQQLTQGAAVLTADDITRLIRTAVASVLGADVADDQPLVEAGLDSLGESSRCRSI